MKYKPIQSVALICASFILSVLTGCGSNQPPLHTAILENNKEQIRKLIAKPKNVNSINAKGETPFQFAARKGQIETMDLLFQAGGNMNLRDVYSFSPLLVACKYGQYDATKWLLDHHCDLQSCNNQGINAVYMAAYYRHNEILALLLKEDKVNVTKVTNNGNSPLGAACDNTYNDYCKTMKEVDKTPISRENYELNQLLTIQMLLSHGADANTSNDSGNMPIHFLVLGKSSTASLSFLIEHGAKIDTYNNNGYLPIHNAAWVDDTNSFNYLFEKGSPHPDHPFSIETSGKTDMFMARYYGNKNNFEEKKNYYSQAKKHFEDEIAWDKSEVKRISDRMTELKLTKFGKDFGAFAAAVAIGLATGVTVTPVTEPLNLTPLEKEKIRRQDAQSRCEGYLRECNEQLRI